MTLEPPKVVHLDQIESVPGGSLTWRPVRTALGVRAFGCNAYTPGAAGEDVVEPHTEDPKLVGVRAGPLTRSDPERGRGVGAGRRGLRELA